MKVGSSSLVDPRGRARPRVFASIARDVAALTAAGTPVVVVSSGAVAMGLAGIGRQSRPGRLHWLQAASAAGQPALHRRWELALRRHGCDAAQVLLTSGDLHRRDGYVNARATLEALHRWGRVPVVNENDSTATDEITFGDNDALAAQVAVLMRSRLLVLLTDTDGLYDRDPSQPGAVRVVEVTDHGMLEKLDVDGRGSAWGRGGMRSKVVAAEMARTGGAAVVIAAERRARGGRRRSGRPARGHALSPRSQPAFCLQAVDPLRQAGARADARGRGRPAGRAVARDEPLAGGGDRRRRELRRRRRVELGGPRGAAVRRSGSAGWSASERAASWAGGEPARRSTAITWC